MIASTFTFSLRPERISAVAFARRTRLALQQWINRRRSLRQLAELDDRLLRDVGISHAQVWEECGAKLAPLPAEHALRTLTWR